MEVQELRIGNYVMLDNPKYRPRETGQIHKVIGFSEKSVHVMKIEDNLLEDYYGQFIEYIQPIPLTDDYFDVISGSERMITYFDVVDECDHYLIFEIDEDGNYYYTGGGGVKLSRTIQYVHELQNLAWELERAEITFN